MTTIAYKDGVLAADSCETVEGDDSGTYEGRCLKLFKVGPFAVALQGDSSPGMAWLHWFRTAHADVKTDNTYNSVHGQLKHVPADIVDRFLEREADFTAVVLCPGKYLFIYDEWGVPIQVSAPFYAVGSGAKAALGAMAGGLDAVAAVEAACVVDPYTSGPIHSEKL